MFLIIPSIINILFSQYSFPTNFFQYSSSPPCPLRQNLKTQIYFHNSGDKEPWLIWHPTPSNITYNNGGCMSIEMNRFSRIIIIFFLFPISFAASRIRFPFLKVVRLIRAHTHYPITLNHHDGSCFPKNTPNILLHT